MLTVFRSNRAEWLADLLSEKLRLTPPDPFETVEIIVNTWPTCRWLGEKLATNNGISAGVLFPFPGLRLRELVKAVLGDDELASDPWIGNELVWKILEIFPEFLTTKAATPINDWMSQHPSQPEFLNRETWQLVRTIADAFDQYTLYRSDVLEQWLKYPQNKSSNRATESFPDNWQPCLLQLISKTIKTEPFGLQVKQAIEKLKRGEAPAKKLPKQLYLFGISSLAPVQVELLQGLSGIIEISIFLLTPCKDLWVRCKDRRERLGSYWTDTPNGSWLLEAPRLEANLGRMGAEFQQLLEGSGESQLGCWEERDLFAAPVKIATYQKRKPTFLEQLQQQLASPASQRALTRTKGDSSLVFVGCAGKWREVQLIRDQLLQWLADDTTLQPRDILIMTPQINNYAPIISSIFNDISATGVELPWRLTDRSQQHNSEITQFLLQFLQLASSRFTATGLDSLLSNPAFQEKQQLNQEEIDSISNYLQQAGFRWGIDSIDRNGDEIHSLNWCLDRLLLGLIIPTAPGVSHESVAPFSNGISYNDLEKWWIILSKISNYIQEIRKPRTCQQSVEVLHLLINDLLGNGGNWEWEHKTIVNALEEWKISAGDCQLKIEVSVVEEILNELVKKQAGRFGHRSGLMTISALEPMRAIPHRVIILMGIDAEIFPRHKEHPSFHLLGQRRQLGDPSSTDQDRYSILEALMSARQHLMITWTNKNEKTGEEIPASSPVQQWLDQLQNELSEEDWEGLIKTPHPSPIARENFLAVNNNHPISCDRRHLETQIEITKGLKQNLLGLALPIKWSPPDTIEKLQIPTKIIRDWLKAPQRIWLEQLKLNPREWAKPLQDLEDLSLSEWKRNRLLKERIDEFSRLLSTHSFNEIKSSSFQQRYAGQGLLPPYTAADIEVDILEKRWSNVQLLLNSLGPIKKETIFCGDQYEEILWAGNFAVILEIGTLKSKNVMDGWLTHLQLCATQKRSISTVIISQNPYKSKSDNFEISIQWSPLTSHLAKKELTNLSLMAAHGLKQCWPVPPESGWALAKEKQQNSSNGPKAFQKQWNGVYILNGERSKSEMELCFGDKLDYTDFLHNESFQRAFNDLYCSLLKSLETTKIR